MLAGLEACLPRGSLDCVPSLALAELNARKTV